MARVNKGKKRAFPIFEKDFDSVSSATSESPAPVEVEEQPAKKSKKAVTRPCPVCHEDIPVRLLEKHLELELHRVDEILKEPLEVEAGPSTGRRGAAVKARKSMTALNPRSTSNLDMLEQVTRMIRTVKRNRKNRHAKLKEIIAQEEDQGLPLLGDSLRTVCPVCLAAISGDNDVLQAHVDACLIHASQQVVERATRDRQGSSHASTSAHTDTWGEVEVDGQLRVHLTNAAGLRGSGFHVRDADQADVDDDIDVDGDDEAVFGDAQFTEGDVLDPVNGGDTEMAVDIDDTGDSSGNADTSTLRDLVAQGKVVNRMPLPVAVAGIKAEMEEIMGVGDTERMDRAIQSARQARDPVALIAALENKVKQLEAMRVLSSTSSLCRICLDPYTEPTVSTGCWHTCCRDCWLRCLGSTKLCPICKRITAAADLRRIYM